MYNTEENIPQFIGYTVKVFFYKTAQNGIAFILSPLCHVMVYTTVYLHQIIIP